MSGSSMQVSIIWPKTVCQQDGGEEIFQSLVAKGLI